MTAPSLTRIGVVVDRLVAIAKTLGEDLQVVDGPYIGELDPRVFVIGLMESPERPGYSTSVRRQEGMGRPRLVEDFEVRCLLSIASGDIDMEAVRNECVQILTNLDVALRDDHHQADVWDRVLFGPRTDWVPLQTPNGAVCNVLFTVEGTSLL